MTIDAFGSWRHSSHKSRNRSPGVFFLYFFYAFQAEGSWGVGAGGQPSRLLRWHPCPLPPVWRRPEFSGGTIGPPSSQGGCLRPVRVCVCASWGRWGCLSFPCLPLRRAPARTRASSLGSGSFPLPTPFGAHISSTQELGFPVFQLQNLPRQEACPPDSTVQLRQEHTGRRRQWASCSPCSRNRLSPIWLPPAATLIGTSLTLLSRIFKQARRLQIPHPMDSWSFSLPLPRIP